MLNLLRQKHGIASNEAFFIIFHQIYYLSLYCIVATHVQHANLGLVLLGL